MDKFKEQLNKCIQAIERIANMINLQQSQVTISAIMSCTMHYIN